MGWISPLSPPDKPIPGQSKDRWNPVDRELVYLNFRSELSGFDKFLYWAKPKPTQRYPTKQDRLVASSRQVKNAIDLQRTSHTLWGRETLFENRALTSEELSCVCAILEKEYVGARLLRHSYYGGHSELTVVFEKDGAKYSEAFAGSGELAVVSLVTRILAAEKFALVLLDEPEVSLHPAAQERIAIFLMEVSLRKKLQVIFTTHSASLVKHLPPPAIKVFVERSDRKFHVLPESPPVAAFQRLGVSLPGRLRVLVEDALAKVLVEVAIRSLPEHERQAVDVDFLPGGADAYLSQRIPTLMHEKNAPLILLDGDQDRGNDVPDPNQIPVALEHTMAHSIRTIVGCDPVLLPDGGEGKSQRQLERQYLAFLRSNVRYLPCLCPEQSVLESLGESPLPSSSQSCKERLRVRTLEEMGNDDGQSILQFSRVKLNEKRAMLPSLSAVANLIKTQLASLA